METEQVVQAELSAAPEARSAKGQWAFAALQLAGVALTLFIFIGALHWDWDGPRMQWILRPIAYGLIFSQLVLAAAATVFGPWNLLVRLTVPPALIAGEALVIVWWSVEPEMATGETLMIVAIVVACLAAMQVPLWVIHWTTGWRVVPGNDPRIQAGWGRDQFSIRQILIFTLVVAGVLGAGRAFVPVEIAQQFAGAAVQAAASLAVILGAVLGIGSAAIYCTLRLKSLWLAITGIAVVTGALCGLFYWMVQTIFASNAQPTMTAIFVLGMLFEAAWMGASLAPLRRKGWRLAALPRT